MSVKPVVVVYQGTLTIQEQWENFHAANPWVYDALEKLTADAVAQGRTRIGVKWLVEELRWMYAQETTGDLFKLNNNFTSRYVRALIDAHPEWADVFHLRALKAA
jgi:hypothetical protein